MRDEFEKWCEEELNLRTIRLTTGDYQSFGADMAWRAWQASRADIVVKLPETPNRGVGYGLFDAGKERCADAIREAGLRVEE